MIFQFLFWHTKFFINRFLSLFLSFAWHLFNFDLYTFRLFFFSKCAWCVTTYSFFISVCVFLIFLETLFFIFVAFVYTHFGLLNQSNLLFCVVNTVQQYYEYYDCYYFWDVFFFMYLLFQLAGQWFTIAVSCVCLVYTCVCLFVYFFFIWIFTFILFHVIRKLFNGSLSFQTLLFFDKKRPTYICINLAFFLRWREMVKFFSNFQTPKQEFWFYGA